MDADCLIKLTKAGLKDLVCKAFTVVIPSTVKMEVVDNAKKYPDAQVIMENIEKKALEVDEKPSTSRKGEEAVFKLFMRSTFDAVCSDDKRFIKRLRLFDIPYLTPAVLIAVLFKEGRLTINEAEGKLEMLKPFISDDEYNAVKIIIKRWGVS